METCSSVSSVSAFYRRPKVGSNGWDRGYAAKEPAVPIRWRQHWQSLWGAVYRCCWPAVSLGLPPA